METKICSKCKRELPLDNFRWKNKSQGKKHSQCKECQSESDKRYYRESLERQNAVKTLAQQQKQANVEYVEFRKECGCAKCGEKRKFALDFHHRNPEEKVNEISHMIKSASISNLEKEINKCILLCSICHREFHILEKELNITLEQYLNGDY